MIEPLVHFLVPLILLVFLFTVVCNMIGLGNVPKRIGKRVSKPVVAGIENVLVWAITLPFVIVGRLSRMAGRAIRRAFLN